MNGGGSNRHRIGLDDFELTKVLGKGSFGKVLLVKKKDSGVGSAVDDFTAVSSAVGRVRARGHTRMHTTLRVNSAPIRLSA